MVATNVAVGAFILAVVVLVGGTLVDLINTK